MPPYGEIAKREDNDENPIRIEISLDLGELTKEMLERAQNELGETPEIRTKALIDLRSLINERAELMCRTDDEFLIRFLRARSFKIEVAYNLLKNYLKFKHDHPDLHENVYPLEFRFLGEDGVISTPPYKDQHGRRIMYMKVGKWDPSKYSMIEIIKIAIVLMEIGVLEPASTVTGSVCIFDLSNLSLSHVWNMSPRYAQIIVDLLAKSFPLVIHGIHVINQPFVFNAMYAFFKPLLDKRMQAKIHFHGSDYNRLHEHISPKHLPKCYGGIHEEYSYELWLEYLKDQQQVKDALRRLNYKFKEDN